MRRWLLVAVALTATACGTRVREAAPLPALVQPVTEATNPGAAPDPAAPAAPAGATTPVAGSASRPNTGVGGESSPATAPVRPSPAEPGKAQPQQPSGSPVNPAPATPGPAKPVAPAPKQPFNIGQVGVLSGPIGANMKAVADGVRIWVRWVNERGGVNGHTVNLIQGDSAGDPARHRALVQQFVEQKKVVAFVGQPGDTFSGAGSVDYLTRAGVPVVGSEGGAQWYYESPVYFPQMPHGRVLLQTLAVGTALEMKNRQQARIGLWTCVEAQTCNDVDRDFPKVLGRRNVSVVHQSKVSIGQPDFTAECLNARNAGAQTIALFADGATISRAAASCARQSYRPTWVIYGAEISPELHAKDTNLDGAIVVDITAPWFLTNRPARKEFVDAAARFAPGLVPGSGMNNGWVAGKLFEAALAARPEAELTPAAVLSALGAVHGDVLADLTGPLLFNPGRPATPSTCYYNETTSNGRWVSPDNGERHCFDYDASI